MYSPTLLKLLEIFMECLLTEKCWSVNFQNYLTKFSYYCNYLLNYHKMNVVMSKIRQKNLQTCMTIYFWCLIIA